MTFGFVAKTCIIELIRQFEEKNLQGVHDEIKVFDSFAQYPIRAPCSKAGGENFSTIRT